MQFSDTANKFGLIQDCERFTNLGEAGISSNPTLLAHFTALLNIRYASTLAKIQLLSGVSGAEDSNYSDQQFSLFDIVEGQHDYTFIVDGDGNTIADIIGILLQSSDSSDFTPLDKLSHSDTNALLVMSPNASNTGTPSGYLEKGNTVFFDVIPDYSKEGGGKLFYRLVPSYFLVGDTTKKPGFEEGCHRVLSAGASLDWLNVNKAEARQTIAYVEGELATAQTDLETYIRLTNPTKARMTTTQHSSR